jgi:hypothetical protein
MPRFTAQGNKVLDTSTGREVELQIENASFAAALLNLGYGSGYADAVVDGLREARERMVEARGFGVEEEKAA